ncbi:hypothetical protein EBZ80_18390 [bacterium]|nr:hypothetical protein [bacterium]
MSCLFDSLASFVGTTGAVVRERICAELDTDPTLFPDSPLRVSETHDASTPHAAYVQQMRHPATWGGAIEIKCFCDLYAAHVHVHMVHRGHTILSFTPTHAVDAPVVCHLGYNGSHYWPLSNAVEMATGK